MNKIRQHIPGFADSGQERKEVEFETVEQLLNIEFVSGWANKESLAPNHHRYSISRDGAPYLMAERKDGKFWVIGYLKEDVPELPTWSMEECDARKSAQ